MEMTRQKILDNRKMWIDRLKDPRAKKLKGALGRNETSSCLGHGCQVLKLERRILSDEMVVYGVGLDQENLPYTAVECFGMWDEHGGTIGLEPIEIQGRPYASLIEINDNSEATSQEIGAYLESIIEGGEDTPFKPLSSFPDKVKLQTTRVDNTAVPLPHIEYEEGL